MSQHTLGILIGGLIPMVFFGLSGITSKASAQAGIGVAVYTVLIGIGVVIVGAVLFLFMPSASVNWKSGLAAVATGGLWGTGAALVIVALQKFQAPLGVLAPLYNMNTLVAVLLALWIFAEWKQVHVVQLLIGSALIVAGGILVSRA